MTEHPAKFGDHTLAAIRSVLPPVTDTHNDRPNLLDPFAGVGTIHKLQADGWRTLGVEIEPEWADMHPQTIVGNSMRLSEIPAVRQFLLLHGGHFQAVVTSPAYGNRMADHHDAKDDSRRLTYRHVLGRKLHKQNAGRMQWGNQYRALHEAVWRQCAEVLEPGGLFVLDIADHHRNGRRVPVADWHVATLGRLGFVQIDAREVDAPRMGFGQNADLRYPQEIRVLRKSRK